MTTLTVNRYFNDQTIDWFEQMDINEDRQIGFWIRSSVLQVMFVLLHVNGLWKCQNTQKIDMAADFVVSRAR